MRKVIMCFVFVSLLWGKEVVVVDSLSTLINIGLANNRDLLLENASLRLQYLQRNAQIRRFLPQLDVQVSGKQKVYYDMPDIDERIISIGVQQLVFDGFKSWREQEQNKYELQYATFSLERKKVEFLFQLLSTYFHFLEDEEQLRLQKEFLILQSNEMKVFQRKYEVGEISHPEWLEWELSFRELEQETIEQEASFSNTLFQLIQLLSLPYDSMIFSCQRTKSEAGIQEIYFTESYVLNEVLQHSWELQMIQVKIAMAKKQRLLENQFLPDITFSFGYSTSLLQPFRQTDMWRIGLNVSFPFFFDKVSLSEGLEGDLGRFEPAVKSAGSTTVFQDETFITKLEKEKIDIASFLNEYEKTKNQLVFQAKSVLRDLQLNSKRYVLMCEQKKLMEMKLDIQRKQLEVGEIRSQDYLAALYQYRNMQKKLIESRFDYYTKLVELYKLMGLLKEEKILSLFQDFFVEKEEIDASPGF